MDDQPRKREGNDTHDRLLRIEIEQEQWKESVERRLSDCSTGMRWVVGLIGTALVGLVVTLLTRIS